MKTLSKPKKTMVQKAKEQSHRVRSIVCQYLGWSEDRYNNHQLEQYEAFLGNLFYGFPQEMLNEVRYSALMAGFWKNEWTMRNERDFIPISQDELESSMWIDANGEIGEYQPNNFNKKQVHDEYLYINGAMTLINDDYFMAGYNEVLKLIRKENRA